MTILLTRRTWPTFCPWTRASKPSSMALEDVAAAAAVYEHAVRDGRGLDVNLAA
jgi:hypothetical protein